ncbi:MAG TPA: UvrD-helicase domain-containing protein [Candidatus Paceibacterota bacterium]|nr:UvrD-helicase domain-containing protein [Candidatus Paceibacterota bacterium]
MQTGAHGWEHGLNERQLEAAGHTEGPLLIVAGAGAGKTKTLTHRIAHLIKNGAPPEAILAVTFTNKAAKEMRERVGTMLAEGSRSAGWNFPGAKGIPWIGTFHSLGVFILREKGEKLGLTKTFAILDRDDALALIKQAMAREGIDKKEFEPKRLQSVISRLKGDFKTPEDALEHSKNRHFSMSLSRVWRRYDALATEAGALDFDDLLVKTVRLLETDQEVRHFYQERWRYLHVDEYQDTNEVQYRMMSVLAAARKNICVVGDSDQNIYSWRGASIANILEFEEDYPGAAVVLLEQNYRSTKTILDAANQVIAKNQLRKPKRLFTENPGGDPIMLFESYDESDEARWISETIGSLLQTGARPRDVAILYRTNFQSRAIEEAMLASGISYQVLGVRFYDRREVKDVLAYLRAAMNPRSALDVARTINVPARGIGKVTLEKVLTGRTSELSAAMQAKVNGYFSLLGRLQEKILTAIPSEAIAYAIQETGFGTALGRGDEEDQERLENVKELVTLAKRYDELPIGEGMPTLLADVALLSEQDNMKEHADAVRLMTVHAAKGLEFPYVFIAGLEQDLFPSKRAWDDSKDPSEREEERRLFYVALTRAAKRVHLSYASFRTIFGERQINAPSEFLSDIDGSLIKEATRGGIADSPAGGKPKKKISLLEWDDDNERIVYF